MFNNDFKDTGSIAQNALRLGFQKTCTSGLKVLLNLDDKTKEACQEFLDRHLKAVEEAISPNSEYIQRRINSLTADFHNESIRYLFDYPRPLNLIRFIKMELYKWRVRRQDKREFEIIIDKISNPELDVSQGVWVTKLTYTVIKHEWSGWRGGKKISVPREVTSQVVEVITRAKKASLKFIPYDEYTEYLPDEATEAGYQAKAIGLTKLKVVVPVVNNVRDYDPILVGFVNNEMFLIAWVGYNPKEPLSCNI